MNPGADIPDIGREYFLLAAVDLTGTASANAKYRRLLLMQLS